MAEEEPRPRTGADVFEAIRSRRSVRRFRSEMPDRSLIEKLIEAAVAAPSASNQQPWRFWIATNRELIGRMADAVRDAVDRIALHIDPSSRSAFRAYGDYFTRFEEAPVVIVALDRNLTILSNLTDPTLPAEDREQIAAMERKSGILGTAMAMQNLLLMAHDLGLGASGMTGPLVAEVRLRQILGVPPSLDIAALVAVGYPAETPPPTERKPIEKVIRWFE